MTEKAKAWWSDDGKWFCILVNDGVNQATVSLTPEEAVNLSTALSRSEAPVAWELGENEKAVTVTIISRGDNENTPEEALHHDLTRAYKAGFIGEWTDASPPSQADTAVREALDRAEEAEGYISECFHLLDGHLGDNLFSRIKRVNDLAKLWRKNAEEALAAQPDIGVREWLKHRMRISSDHDHCQWSQIEEALNVYAALPPDAGDRG